MRKINDNSDKIIELIIVPTLFSSMILASRPTPQTNGLPREYSQICVNLGHDNEARETFARCRTIGGKYEESSIDPVVKNEKIHNGKQNYRGRDSLHFSLEYLSKAGANL